MLYKRFSIHAGSPHVIEYYTSAVVRLWSAMVSRFRVRSTSKIMSCGHGSSSVVWSHKWPDSQPNVIQTVFYSCGVPHEIEYFTSAIVRLWSAMVSWFRVRCTSKIMSCGDGSSSVVWSRKWPDSQPNVIQTVFYSCGSPHVIEYYTSTVVRLRNAMVSRFRVRSTSKIMCVVTGPQV